jgi:hypothetical protein
MKTSWPAIIMHWMKCSQDRDLLWKEAGFPTKEKEGYSFMALNHEEREKGEEDIYRAPKKRNISRKLSSFVHKFGQDWMLEKSNRGMESRVLGPLGPMGNLNWP